MYQAETRGDAGVLSLFTQTSSFLLTRRCTCAVCGGGGRRVKRSDYINKTVSHPNERIRRGG